MRANLDKTPARPLWRAEDVGQILDVSPKTVHRLVREGKLSCVQVTGRERRFTEKHVLEFIERQSRPVRVDKKEARPVSSPPKKGGEKSSGFSGVDLRKEMKQWR